MRASVRSWIRGAPLAFIGPALTCCVLFGQAGKPQQPSISAPVISKPRPSLPFPIGQTYVYTAQWRVFNAGTATLRMESAGRENRIVATADGAGAVAVLYHVQDRLESFFDPTTFCSRSTSRHVEEGFRRVETSITFDYANAKSVFDQKNLKKKDSKHVEHEIPPCVTDMLSGIYYAGSLPLEPGKMFSFPLNDGGPTVIINLHVEGREELKTPAGTFKTVRVQPEAASGLVRDKGKLWIWYSEDLPRIPVQMRARMSWGTLTFILQRIDKK
ncbi:MAG TPA: DUF3108 domain-containing protein [Candidatus Angelobacter sp.]|nr:DUF3108 domain-containing protein [Candidatus Angelobacter sp.]